MEKRNKRSQQVILIGVLLVLATLFAGTSSKLIDEKLVTGKSVGVYDRSSGDEYGGEIGKAWRDKIPTSKSVKEGTVKYTTESQVFVKVENAILSYYCKDLCSFKQGENVWVEIVKTEFGANYQRDAITNIWKK